MKQTRLLFLLIAALAFTSCRPTAQQTAADAEQPTDSTEAVTSADTLRLVIADKSLSRTDTVIQRKLKLPLDSIVVEIINKTDSTCVTGEAYTIEQRVNDVWTILPIKPRKDGAVYAFNDIGYELAPPHPRPLPPDQTDRRPHPLRRLLHPQQLHLPHTFLQVRNKLFSAKECKNYQ